MTDVFDSVMATVQSEAAAAPAIEQPKPADDAIKPENDSTPEPKGAEEEEFVPFPKKAVNAISRRDKQIFEMKQREAQLKADIAKLQATAPKPDDAPKEDQFTHYGEFLKAKAIHDFKEQQTKEAEAAKTQELSEVQKKWVTEREGYIEGKAKEAATKLPDYFDVMKENMDLIAKFSPAVERAFYEADNAPMAFYALGKEGKLEDLNTMSPFQVAATIARAEDRGLAMFSKAAPEGNEQSVAEIPAKPAIEISKAPKPLTPNKGSGSTEKPLDKMTASELLEFVNS